MTKNRLRSAKPVFFMMEPFVVAEDAERLKAKAERLKLDALVFQSPSPFGYFLLNFKRKSFILFAV